jgi:hypothetical protein
MFGPGLRRWLGVASIALALAAAGCGSSGADGVDAGEHGAGGDGGALGDADGGAAGATTSDGGATDSAARGPVCNGAAALCARPFDQICLAGAHNAMSSKAEGWAFPNQDLAFVDLLDLGIRALLLDVYIWDDPDDDAPAALHLCHGSCLLGHRRFDAALADLRAWLDAHPRDFVLIVFEDHAPAADVSAAIVAAGLAERAYAHDGGAWPTLGAMLDDGRQLLLSAEQGGGEPAWYHHVWSLQQDTPYTFHSQAELRADGPADDSCRHYRGDKDAPLFSINHWVAKVLPTQAQSDAANALDVLLARAERCRATRGHVVNSLVVDHANRGDVVRAVRILNGLEPAP